MRIVLAVALFAASVSGQHRASSAASGRAGRPVSTGPSRPANPAPRPVTPSRPAPPAAPRVIVAPYPIFVGGGYYSGYTAAPTGDPTVAVVNPNYQADSGSPQIIDYSMASLPEPAAPDDANTNLDEAPLLDDQPTVYLIALTDHTVLASIAYWVDGDTLNWVSRDAKQNRVSLSLVDRTFSQQLNDERRVPFKLPQPE